MKNAIKDARAVAKALRSKGVHVVDVYDCTISMLNAVVKQFVASVQPGDAVIIYFAGHGCEYNNINRLLAISESAEPNVKEDSLNVLLLIDRFAISTHACHRHTIGRIFDTTTTTG